jgi:NAD(P)-dependent dehydrogenase (short-subunit alcohol dehydrogenase family)
MQSGYLENLFGLSGKVAVITGAAGALCSAIARGFSAAGATVALLDVAAGKVEQLAQAIRSEGGVARPYTCNVLEKASLQKVAESVLADYGRVDVLVNGVGGNRPEATTGPELSFFDLPEGAIRSLFELNFLSAFLCCQAFGRAMAKAGRGAVINIISINAYRPLTRIPAYAAAKAALANFTQWLAVHVAHEYSKGIRVNGIAPGFFLTDQNRFLLLEEGTGELTPRGKSILSHTPAGRFGEPQDLVGAALWLASEAAAFVTGAVIPVDGGFHAYAGV